MMIMLPESDEDLLRECEVDTFVPAARAASMSIKLRAQFCLTHLPSGVVVTSQQERSQHRNKALCLEKAAPESREVELSSRQTGSHAPAAQRKEPDPGREGAPLAHQALTLKAHGRRMMLFVAQTSGRADQVD